MTSAEFWETTIPLLWDEPKLVCGVEQLFLQLGLSKSSVMLDCSCGIGFPGLELLERGWSIELSDGSPAMLSRLRERAAIENTSHTHLVKWNALRDHFGVEQFELVMCRGNSLVYCDTWEEELPSQIACSPMPHTSAEVALTQMYHTLQPGGYIYVDKYQDGPDGSMDFGPVSVGGETYTGRWQVETIQQGTARLWSSELFQNANLRDKRAMRSMKISDADLLSLIHHVGFEDGQKLEVMGESTYANFVAQKPSGKLLKPQ